MIIIFVILLNLLVWVNESVESGLPYDIKITNNIQNEESETEEITFIEVKTTTNVEKYVLILLL